MHEGRSRGVKCRGAQPRTAHGANIYTDASRTISNQLWFGFWRRLPCSTQSFCPRPRALVSLFFMADLRTAFLLADSDAPVLAKGLDDKLAQAVADVPILVPTSKKAHILGKI